MLKYLVEFFRTKFILLFGFVNTLHPSERPLVLGLNYAVDSCETMHHLSYFDSNLFRSRLIKAAMNLADCAAAIKRVGLGSGFTNLAWIVLDRFLIDASIGYFSTLCLPDRGDLASYVYVACRFVQTLYGVLQPYWVGILPWHTAWVLGGILFYLACFNVRPLFESFPDFSGGRILTTAVVHMLFDWRVTLAIDNLAFLFAPGSRRLLVIIFRISYGLHILWLNSSELMRPSEGVGSRDETGNPLLSRSEESTPPNDDLSPNLEGNQIAVQADALPVSQDCKKAVFWFLLYRTIIWNELRAPFRVDPEPLKILLHMDMELNLEDAADVLFDLYKEIKENKQDLETFMGTLNGQISDKHEIISDNILRQIIAHVNTRFERYIEVARKDFSGLMNYDEALQGNKEEIAKLKLRCDKAIYDDFYACKSNTGHQTLFLLLVYFYSKCEDIGVEDYDQEEEGGDAASSCCSDEVPALIPVPNNENNEVVPRVCTDADKMMQRAACKVFIIAVMSSGISTGIQASKIYKFFFKIFNGVQDPNTPLTRIVNDVKTLRITVEGMDKSDIDRKFIASNLDALVDKYYIYFPEKFSECDELIDLELYINHLKTNLGTIKEKYGSTTSQRIDLALRDCGTAELEKSLYIAIFNYCYNQDQYKKLGHSNTCFMFSAILLYVLSKARSAAHKEDLLEGSATQQRVSLRSASEDVVDVGRELELQKDATQVDEVVASPRPQSLEENTLYPVSEAEARIEKIKKLLQDATTLPQSCTPKQQFIQVLQLVLIINYMFEEQINRCLLPRPWGPVIPKYIADHSILRNKELFFVGTVNGAILSNVDFDDYPSNIWENLQKEGYDFLKDFLQKKYNSLRSSCFSIESLKSLMHCDLDLDPDLYCSLAQFSCLDDWFKFAQQNELQVLQQLGACEDGNSIRILLRELLCDYWHRVLTADPSSLELGKAHNFNARHTFILNHATAMYLGHMALFAFTKLYLDNKSELEAIAIETDESTHPEVITKQSDLGQQSEEVDAPVDCKALTTEEATGVAPALTNPPLKLKAVALAYVTIVVIVEKLSKCKCTNVSNAIAKVKPIYSLFKLASQVTKEVKELLEKDVDIGVNYAIFSEYLDKFIEAHMDQLQIKLQEIIGDNTFEACFEALPDYLQEDITKNRENLCELFNVIHHYCTVDCMLCTKPEALLETYNALLCMMIIMEGGDQEATSRQIEVSTQESHFAHQTTTQDDEMHGCTRAIILDTGIYGKKIIHDVIAATDANSSQAEEMIDDASKAPRETLGVDAPPLEEVYKALGTDNQQFSFNSGESGIVTEEIEGHHITIEESDAALPSPTSIIRMCTEETQSQQVPVEPVPVEPVPISTPSESRSSSKGSTYGGCGLGRDPINPSSGNPQRQITPPFYAGNR